MNNFTPREIVSYLDKHIIKQNEAKKSVAIALRNRWRRKQLSEDVRKHIIPKNILMMGPTGVGKTEISRKIAVLDDAPFVKVEATKFTEVGYVGRDVEQIIRDLVEVSIQNTKEKQKNNIRVLAEKKAEERILKALIGKLASEETKAKFTEKLRKREFEDKIIDVDVIVKKTPATLDVSNGSQISMLPITDLLGGNQKQTKKKSLKVSQAREILINEEAEELISEDDVIEIAIKNVEENGIVVIDEIDKIVNSGSVNTRGSVSREGVQRDLLPIIEGTRVNTKYGTVQTDHILFIGLGAFHVSKPSDMLPELQGRFPIRVELESLDKEDFIKILQDTKNNLLEQYKSLIGTENVKITFTEDAVDEIAEIAVKLNDSVENIGARRLYTVAEKLIEDISFSASENEGKEYLIDRAFVSNKLANIVKSNDLSHQIL